MIRSRSGLWLPERHIPRAHLCELLSISNLIGFGPSEIPRTYATLSPSDKNGNITLSNGNLTATGGASLGAGVRAAVRATLGITGKVYFELSGATGSQNSYGWALAGTSLTPDAGLSNIPNNCVYYQGTLTMWNGNNTTNLVTQPSFSGVLGVAIDAPNNRMRLWSSGGSEFTDGTGTVMAGGPPYYPFYIASNPSEAMTFNFGAAAFSYTVPAGYQAGLYS